MFHEFLRTMSFFLRRVRAFGASQAGESSGCYLLEMPFVDLFSDFEGFDFSIETARSPCLMPQKVP